MIDRAREIEEHMISKDQGGFRDSWATLAKNFTFRMLVEKCLEKGKTLYTVFVNLENTHDKVNRRPL